ncbi:hypothetical protein MuYL_2843 [Mucilaginibacter xinganensis]|uniref:Uncharacterized protein n=1 Tax=Mucilaginibacter xinganensis TaxID=1234841 RepID=A0A223NY74_9SPHI|nr:hypothetical protein MuYL_2843 [Mucilaginibacter xinganensis]
MTFLGYLLQKILKLQFKMQYIFLKKFKQALKLHAKDLLK